MSVTGANHLSHKSDSDKCPAREARCFACARFCKNPGRAKREAPRSRNEYESNAKKRKTNVRNIEDEEDIICNVNSADVNVVCQIGKVHVRMLVDSGTNRNIIDDKTWKLMVAKGFQPERELMESHVKFLGYGNVKLKQLAAFEAEIVANVNGRCHKELTKFFVIENGSQPLLSKGTAKALQILKITRPDESQATVNAIVTSDDKVLPVLKDKVPFPKIKGV